MDLELENSNRLTKPLLRRIARTIVGAIVGCSVLLGGIWLARSADGDEEGPSRIDVTGSESKDRTLTVGGRTFEVRAAHLDAGGEFPELEICLTSQLDPANPNCVKSTLLEENSAPHLEHNDFNLDRNDDDPQSSVMFILVDNATDVVVHGASDHVDWAGPFESRLVAAVLPSNPNIDKPVAREVICLEFHREGKVTYVPAVFTYSDQTSNNTDVVEADSVHASCP